MTTRIGQPSLPDTLRSVVDGPVFVAGSPGYESARTPYFTHRLGTPVAAVRPQHADDVAATIHIAQETDTPLAVRSGGHSVHSTGDGIILDMGSLNGLDLDIRGQTAWVGTGLTTGELSRALTPHGLAVGFGDTGSVGIGGITLGGGIGFLSRRHGLTIDNLLAAEIVTADGRVRIVDPDNEPDLFWAIRGGGGHFGVVTRMRFRLAELSDMYGGVIVLPATVETIADLAAVSSQASDDLTVIANIMPIPPLPFLPASVAGSLGILARVCYSGREDGAEAVRPLREITTP